MHLIMSLTLALLLPYLTSCSTLRTPPETARGAAAIDPHKAWASVLAEYVDDKGLVNFKGLQKNPSKLHAYVAWLANHGPLSQPGEYKTQQQKLAHYINAYNALSMFNILEADIPPSNSGIFRKLNRFIFAKFVIDGQQMNLKSYEDDIIRAVGDERVHFALNCMSMGCPKLPSKPFVAATLDADFDAGARLFFSEERNCRRDDKERAVYLSEILNFFPEDFLKKSPTLIAYANRWRKDKIPDDYKVKFTSYDWNLNAQPGAGVAEKNVSRAEGSPEPAG